MKLHFALITKNRNVESMVDPGQRRNKVEGKRFNFRFLGGRETEPVTTLVVWLPMGGEEVLNLSQTWNFFFLSSYEEW